MSCRLSAFALVATLIGAQFGCHTSHCGQRQGWFTSNSRCDPPCQLVGRNGGCFDAATGQPCPCPPDVSPGVIPNGVYPPIGPVPGGGYPYPRPGELHMPSPSDMLPPSAVPIPAPGDATLPFPASPGTPVKSGLNK